VPLGVATWPPSRSAPRGGWTGPAAAAARVRGRHSAMRSQCWSAVRVGGLCYFPSLAAASRKVRAFFREVFACWSALVFPAVVFGVSSLRVWSPSARLWVSDDYNILIVGLGGKINRFLSEIKTDLVVVCVRDAFL